MVNFEVSRRNLGRSRITDEATGMSVEVQALDEIATGLNLDNLGFVKIDVEGHEDKVIAGAREVLSATKPIIALEGFYKADRRKGSDVSAMLDDLGYRHFYRLSDRRSGEWRALHSAMPKFARRSRELSLERIDELLGEDHPLVIVAAETLQ